jgi:hypothetical protein
MAEVLGTIAAIGKYPLPGALSCLLVGRSRTNAFYG